MAEPTAGNNASWFGFEFDKTLVKRLTSVSEVTMGNAVSEHIETTPDGKYVNTFSPGRPTSGEVTIEREPLDNVLAEWMSTTNKGDAENARRSGSVIAYDSTGKEVYRYVLTNCMAKEYRGAGSTARDNSVRTESLTFVYEAVEMKFA